MHRLQEPKRRVVVSHRRASTRVNNVVLQTFNQDIDIVAKQKMICVYIYLHWINIPKMNYPSFWSVQNFSYIWKHRQHQDVQEDLPGVGCAVTFFLCAFHGQTRADGGTTEVLGLLSDRSTMIYSGAERGS